jgi:SAM-dependent methyltransferase
MTAQKRALGATIPCDHSRQTRADYYVREFSARPGRSATVLDLGCGVGRSRERFAGLDPTVRWVGVDLPSSPEVDGRRELVPGVAAFDGMRLPFRDAGFDGVFSQQVLEHVRHPELLLREVCRVLRAGGVFFGSTSHLEPYHSRSLWNFTPYGFKTIVEDAGLKLEEIRPGIDGLTLITRSYSRDHAAYNKYFSTESPLNAEIEQQGAATGLDVQSRNDRKLAYCGHFSFRVRKPIDGDLG